MSIREPKDRCLSPEEAKRFYDRLGSRQDWQDFYENPAINELVAHAAFDSAHSVCEFGCGTGALAARLLQDHLPADTRYVGLHISSTMASPALNSIAHKHYREGVLDASAYRGSLCARDSQRPTLVPPRIACSRCLVALVVRAGGLAKSGAVPAQDTKRNQ